MKNLTILYSSAHKIPDSFRLKIFEQLRASAKNYPIVELHSTPKESSITNYYRELLAAAKQAQTPFLSFAEDDCLYPDDHFNYRPESEVFAYNFNRWNIQTWSNPPFFYLKQRKILATLICERELFVEAFEDKFRADPEGERLKWWGEPGRNAHERQLGIPLREAVDFKTYNPIVVFDHRQAFSHQDGRKRAERIRAYDIPFHGKARDVIKLYKENQNGKVLAEHINTGQE